jgi:prepilin-type N-terminal cleavage/methylation domain-containing protein
MMPSRRQSGFSLIEMIGVLAIIAVLAVIIVPKVFSTIASARLTSAVSSVGAMKSSVVEFAGKYGTLPVTVATSRLDDLLLKDGLIDGRFTVKIGTPQAIPAVAGGVWARNNGVWAATGGASQATQTRLICLASTTGVPSAAGGANYRLDGVAGNNLPVGARVVSAVLLGVTATEARELSFRIDGDAYTETTTATADDRGKVVYAAPNAAGTTNVYIYVVHQ